MENCVKRWEDVGREYKENPSPEFINDCNKEASARVAIL